MTAPDRRPRRNPMLVFAGAAVAVLLAIGIPLLFIDNEEPVAAPGTSTTTSIPGETTTTTPPPEETTSTTEAAPLPTAFETVVYLAQSPENSFLGNPAIVPFATTVEGEANVNVELLTLQLLTLVPEESLPEPGYFNVVPEGVEVLDVRRATGTDNALIVDMNEEFLNGAGGLLSDFTMLNQLIYTATQFDGIEEVQFIVNNQPVEAFGTEGIDLTGSVNRETFQDQLALIYLTEPIVFDAAGSVVVAGISNTFEASMALQVIDAQGAVVHDEFTTATCGSGCWGEYEFILDGSILTPDSLVQVLEFSAEDGEPSNVVTVPLNEGPWGFLR